MLVKKGHPDGAGIIFLHGYGASDADLFPLAEELAWSDRENWYFPQGPLEVPIGPHVSGHAWFQIPQKQLQSGIDYSSLTPPGLEKAAGQVKEFLQTLPHQQLILGGFSQGAMVATQIVVTDPERFTGLVILSGTLFHAGVLKKYAMKEHTVPIFQSHGVRDEVLPYEAAERLHELFEKCRWPVEFHPFRGGHEIPASVIKDLRSYLRAQIV